MQLVTMKPDRGARQGFTLTELMVAMGVLIMLVLIITQITNSVMATTSRTSSKIDAFASARAGFDLVNQRLSQTTLNTYWAYDNPLSPTVYLRQSDLQFIVRQNQQNAGYGQEVYFPAPETYAKDTRIGSTSGLMNACGFFIQYGGNDAFRPATASNSRYRYRLMHGFEPTESSMVFNTPYTSGSAGWIADICNKGGNPVASGSAVVPIAENVIAFIVWPRLSKVSDAAGTRLTGSNNAYGYDSRANAAAVPQPLTANQLPPVVQVTMVIISEASAQRLDTKSSTPPAAIEEALSDRFTDVTKYDSDLEQMAEILVKHHVDDQFFTTAVPLKESRWSDDMQ